MFRLSYIVQRKPIFYGGYSNLVLYVHCMAFAILKSLMANTTANLNLKNKPVQKSSSRSDLKWTGERGTQNGVTLAEGSEENNDSFRPFL